MLFLLFRVQDEADLLLGKFNYGFKIDTYVLFHHARECIKHELRTKINDLTWFRVNSTSHSFCSETSNKMSRKSFTFSSSRSSQPSTFDFLLNSSQSPKISPLLIHSFKNKKPSVHTFHQNQI